ncbi:hypothetical protein LCGC14_1231790 [marine sediment metagenome]|uniref:Uncharacterized protein n=1 Tax=marine sediment metagenome TaxID=412755 RepID=A0A0F9NQH7_9ZZZZ
MKWSFQRVLTRELIEDGAKLSKGYGFAWRDFDTASHVAYPIPFNVLFRGLRRFWHWILSYKNSVLDEARIDGIRRGQEIQKQFQQNQQQAARKLLKK